MKRSLYLRLAADGIRKNKRLYVPYILTCIGMIVMQYIILYLRYDPMIAAMKGGGEVRVMMSFGTWVVALFSCIFLFYTNAFLMRRRKREFGLYAVLGMNKHNIGRILLWESLLTAGLSLFCGLACGIVLSKAAELLLANLLKEAVTYTLYVSADAIGITAAVFLCIFLLLFLNSLRQIRFSETLTLLRSENVGEKPLRANRVCGILGVIVLACAYYVAVTIKDPVAALGWFFFAVLLVIIGTYLLFVAGSVMLCRILQKCKNYYYRPNHFISVSSMAYRMKRNGAGLASICILSTMVLVILSSTASLYFGAEDMIVSRYPRDVNVKMRMYDITAVDAYRAELEAVIAADNVTPINMIDYRSAAIAGALTDTTLEVDSTTADMGDYNRLTQLRFIPLSDYNAAMGTNETLEKGEVLLCPSRTHYDAATLTVAKRGKTVDTFTVKKQVTDTPGSNIAMDITPVLTCIVPDFSESLAALRSVYTVTDEPMLAQYWHYAFDTPRSAEEQETLCDHIRATAALSDADNNLRYSLCENRSAESAGFYANYGGIFFLGILLSVVFILATVLILYYKQVSEGYEDQARFGIMQNVGMTEKEIRRSINSQLLTVFFLPLVGAGVHLAFAFPMILKLLFLFNLFDTGLFILTTLISFAAFSLMYILVYRITAGAYFHIVRRHQNA